jgi:radical SAM protein with 4Fe4S-binding SPASM domain
MDLKNKIKQIAWKHPVLWEGYKFLRKIKRASRFQFQVRPPLKRLRIEITNTCNLVCGMCGNRFMTRKKGLMSRDLFDAIIRQLPDRSMKSISVFALGEPLMHPDLIYFLRTARSKIINDLAMSTNGLLFNKNKDFITEVILSGVNHIHFSCEGFNSETYEKFRVGAKFDDFLENLKMFKDLRDRLNPDIKLHLFYTLAQNHGIEDYRQAHNTFAAHVDEIEFNPLNNAASAKISYRPDEKIFGYKYFRLDKPNVCSLLWEEPTILWDGRVSACSRNHDGELIAGNIRESALLDIWKGEEYQKIREMHRRKCFQEKCQNCFELYADVIERPYINRLIRREANLPDIKNID